MKACIFHGPGSVSVEERAVPEPGPGEILLQVEAAGLCYSDIRVYKGQKQARPGVIPGHETVGRITSLGEGVSGFVPGQRVVLCPIIACGRCYFCQRGARHRCLERRTLGYDDDGGLTETMLVPAAIVSLGHVLSVPEGLAPEVAALTEPAACVLNSLEACALAPGGSLLIIGAGPMGLLHIFLARALGIATVIVSEVNPERLAYARRFGASLAVDPEHEELDRAVLDVTDGLGADAVVLTSGAPALVPDALRLVRRQGMVNLFAGFPPGSAVDLDPNVIHYSEASLRGSQNASTDQYRRALRLLTLIPRVAEINTHRFSIEDGPKAYESRLAMDGLKSLVVF